MSGKTIQSAVGSGLEMANHTRGVHGGDVVWISMNGISMKRIPR